MIDAVDVHLEQARICAAESGVALASITQGVARHLQVPSTIADAVLLLGPLYHLVERSDRLKALQESRRILKPRGVLLAASICRFASLIDGLSGGAAQLARNCCREVRSSELPKTVTEKIKQLKWRG